MAGSITTRVVVATALAALVVAALPAASAAPLRGHQASRATTSWGLDRIDQRTLPLDGRYSPRSAGAGVTTYLIDTGLDTGHPQFGGRASIGRDFFGGAGRDCADELGIGHGTFVAGILGGASTGVANRVRLVALKAVACGEGADPISRKRQVTLLVKALRWILRHGTHPAVVNMSLALDRRSARLDNAVKAVVAAGFPIVAAAGNHNTDACGLSPAGVGRVITVAAADRRDRSWRDNSFTGTGWGSCVDLYAPGKGITSTVAGDGIYRYAGVGATSWATPFVTGVVAQYLQRRPAASPHRVAKWLHRHATRGVVRQTPPGTTHRLVYAS
jgi:subtilisin family serine protease